MRRNVIVSVIMLIMVLWTVGAVIAQEDMEVVDNSVFDHPVRTPSVFVHDAHNELAEIDDCAVCHHLYEDGKLVEDESSEDMQCVECHAQGGPDNPMPLRRAYHLRCKGCHLADNAGPVMCAECHVK